MTDPITLEVIRNGLLSAADEVAHQLVRTSYNTMVYEIHDYGIGIHDADGDVVADTPGIAIYTRGNDYGVKRGIEFVGKENLRAGDIYMINYPYWSSAHGLDVLVFAPIIIEGKIHGYVSCRIHILDLKQRDPGYVLDSTSMYEEGVFFPASRLYIEGKENRDIFNMIRFNSRMPERTVGDVQAQCAACFAGVKRFEEIVDKYSSDTVLEAMREINRQGEELSRQALAKLPEGTWEAEDIVDNDGVDLDRPIHIRVKITIKDGRMTMDWRDSDSDVRGPINLPRGLTEAASCLVFKSITTPDSRVVAGNFAPLEILTKPGSVMHAVPPMPTFTLWTAILAPEVALKALAKAIPDRIPACSGGDVADMMGLGVDPRTNEPWLEATNEAVGFGASAHEDGEDGIMHISEPGCRNNPVESLELRSPMIIDSYGYVTDSGGPGKYRGGVGIERAYRFTSPSSGICIVYKTKSSPWGINGGHAGTNNTVFINPGTDHEERKGGSYNHLDAGDVLLNRTGGGGGYGDPYLRDVAAVEKDVRNGFVSVEGARRDYGVVIDPDTLQVEEEKTSFLRSQRQS